MITAFIILYKIIKRYPYILGFLVLLNVTNVGGSVEESLEITEVTLHHDNSSIVVNEGFTSYNDRSFVSRYAWNNSLFLTEVLNPRKIGSVLLYDLHCCLKIDVLC